MHGGKKRSIYEKIRIFTRSKAITMQANDSLAVILGRVALLSTRTHINTLINFFELSFDSKQAHIGLIWVF